MGCSTAPYARTLDAGLGPGNVSALALSPTGRFLGTVNPADQSVTFFCLEWEKGAYTFETMDEWPPATVSFAKRGTPRAVAFGPGLLHGESAWIVVQSEGEVLVLREYLSGKLSMGLPVLIHRLSGNLLAEAWSAEGTALALAIESTTDGLNLARIALDDESSSPTLLALPSNPASGATPHQRWALGISDDGSGILLADFARQELHAARLDGEPQWTGSGSFPSGWVDAKVAPDFPRWAAIAHAGRHGLPGRWLVAAGDARPPYASDVAAPMAFLLTIDHAPAGAGVGTNPFTASTRSLSTVQPGASPFAGGLAAAGDAKGPLALVSFPDSRMIAAWSLRPGDATPTSIPLPPNVGVPADLAYDANRRMLFVGLADRSRVLVLNLDSPEARLPR